MSYKKRTGDNSQANEIGTIQGNHIQVFADGSGKLIVCFLMLLTIALLIWLWIAVHLLLVLIMICTTIVLCIVGGSAAFRHVSNTVKVHKTNQAEIEWSRLVYQTENLIATLNRSTREITVHNAQQIQEVHHHQPMQIAEQAESKSSLMPKLSDLHKDSQA